MAERLSGGTGRRRIDNTLRRLLLTDHQMQCATTAGSRWYMPGYVCEYCQELAAGDPVVIDSDTLMCVLLHAGLSGIDDYAFGAATAASNSCSTSTAPCRNGPSRKKFRSTNFVETGQLLSAVSTMRGSRNTRIVRLVPTSGPRPARLGDSCCTSRKDRLATANNTCQRSIKMNEFFSRIVGFFRAGNSADAPKLGYVALIAMCPAAAGVVRPSAANGNRLV
jgi:hypothetical protein